MPPPTPQHFETGQNSARSHWRPHMGTSAPLALPYNVMQWLRRHEKFEMEHWSVHDLRRMARTNFSTLTEPHIAEIMLGHRMPGAWQVYDHYDYLPEQAAALTAWLRKLEGLIRA